MEIVLSTPAYLDEPPVIMEEAILRKWFAKISAEKRVQLYCHGDWQCSGDSLKWLISESAISGIDLTLCLNNEADLKYVDQLLTPDLAIEVSLTEGEGLSFSDRLGDSKQASFFLPLTGPDPSPAVLAKALESYPFPAKVTIGVGWENRLSGPAPIEEQDYSSWADSLMSIVESLTVQAETTGKPIQIEFACGLKLCLFNRMQLGELTARSLVWPIAVCPKSFIIQPDGSLEPCVRLKLPESVQFSEAVEFSEVMDGVNKWLAPFSGLCYEAATLDCRSLRVKSCVTGCLQHSMNDWSR